MCALSITDQKGSITGRTNAAGTSLFVNSYSLYGQPDAANVRRFQYTGQVWLEEVGLKPLPGPFSSIFDSRDQKSWLRHSATKDYQARFYDPTIKRFLNADPIGYGDGLNMYSYVGGDPVNRRDPSGMTACDYGDEDCEDEVISTGSRRRGPRLLPIAPFNTGVGVIINTGGFCGLHGCTATGTIQGRERTQLPRPRNDRGCNEALVSIGNAFRMTADVNYKVSTGFLGIAAGAAFIDFAFTGGLATPVALPIFGAAVTASTVYAGIGVTFDLTGGLFLSLGTGDASHLGFTALEGVFDATIGRLKRLSRINEAVGTSEDVRGFFTLPPPVSC